MVKLFPKYLNTKDKAAFVTDSSVKVWDSTLLHTELFSPSS